MLLQLLARKQFLAPLAAHLGTGGLSHVSEIADAAAPFTPRGCPFQAWSLAGYLRLDRQVLNVSRRIDAIGDIEAACV